MDIAGSDGSAAGSLRLTNGTYPRFQMLNWDEDSLSFSFDAYYDGTWRSSDAGSNFQIIKASDTLQLRYDSGVAAGSSGVNWHHSIVLDTSGNVGIGTNDPQNGLHVSASKSAGSGLNNGVHMGMDGAHAAIELVGNGGTPYIDFNNDNTGDADARLILTGNDTLSLQGATHDLSELIPAEEGLEEGDVVIIDTSNDERVVKSAKPYDRLVAGIYSTDPGFLITGPEEYDGHQIPLALAGRVLVKASAENGPIERGDLLVTSSTPGHVMKCTDYQKGQGAIVGKALYPLESGTGKIKALVTLQ
ncbi:MAG: hypothetical protein E3J94_02655 [Desulfobacteraceae bacterium]|nr:MAG: hypothetical protein E3J94_02655 [Desulfobacteraceae bacterium]